MAKLSERLQAINISADAEEVYGFSKNERTPEQKLLIAIIERAILDVIKINGGGYIPDSEDIDGVRTQLRCPYEYLYDTSEEDWSFRWVLGFLFNDSSSMQSFIIKKLESHLR